MTTLIIIALGIVAIASVALFVIHMGRTTDAENEVYLNDWRKCLQRNDLVQCNGITYRLESVDRVCECRTYSDVKFILLTDLYPVD